MIRSMFLKISFALQEQASWLKRIELYLKKIRDVYTFEEQQKRLETAKISGTF